VVADYRGVILVGGTWNPAVVSADKKMLAFIKEAAERRLPIFTICHGAQILINAKLVKGRRVTGSPDIRKYPRNAGADVVEDQPVVVDTGFIPLGGGASRLEEPIYFTIVSSRDPNDLAPFCRAIVEYL
jgi:protease I